MTPCDEARDALTRAIAARGDSLDDALNPARRCTLEHGRTYRLRRDLTTRLHGQNITLAAGARVRVGHALNDLVTLLEPRRDGELLAVTLTRETDPHGWADVFGEPEPGGVHLITDPLEVRPGDRMVIGEPHAACGAAVVDGAIYTQAPELVTCPDCAAAP